jgi:hypothetical protein
MAATDVAEPPTGGAVARLSVTPGDALNASTEIAPEPTGHGLPLSRCEAYNRVYEQPYGSS